MPRCVLCKEVTATDGGMEVHMGRVHAPSPRPTPRPAPAPAPGVPARRAVAPRPPRRWPLPGTDPTIPLTALMIVALLVGAIVAALRL